MTIRLIEVRERQMERNDEMARAVRLRLEDAGIVTLNFVSSPGAGKTTLLERTLGALGQEMSIAVITGDVQTQNDAERIARHTDHLVQAVVTRGGCHLDASQIAAALEEINLRETQLLFIENVGNLVCPASWDLGENAKTVVFSVTEGEDKPLKYPQIFKRSRYALINKVDLLPTCPSTSEKRWASHAMSTRTSNSSAHPRLRAKECGNGTTSCGSGCSSSRYLAGYGPHDEAACSRRECTGLPGAGDHAGLASAAATVRAEPITGAGYDVQDTVTGRHTPTFSALDRAACEAVLTRNTVGRIAFSFHDRVDIEPLHYVFSDSWIYGRTSSGSKLLTLRHSHWVAFEVDEVRGPFDWESVVIHGAFYVVSPEGAETEVQAWNKAVKLLRGLIPETGTENDPVPFRTVVFRIYAEEMSGRAATSRTSAER